MIKLQLLFSLLFFLTSNSLTEIRSKYEIASLSEEKLEDFISTVNKAKISTELKNAYLGAGKAISAKFYFNPINKLSVFNDGKKMIESSIKCDPQNVELRYIRYSIQKNIPSILGYTNNLEEDRKLLKAFIQISSNEKPDPDLYTRIKSYLEKF